MFTKKECLPKNSFNKEKGAIFVPLLIYGLLTAGGIGAIAYWGNGKIAEAAGQFITAIAYFLIQISGSAFNLAAGALTYVTGPSFTNKQIVGYGAFDQSWASVRDLTNMLIVLGFVIVGIATTLRLRDYEAKKLLPWLIFVALFINFSGFFCGQVINVANITTSALLQNGGAQGIFIQLAGSISGYASNVITGATKDGNVDVSDKEKVLEFLRASCIIFIFNLYAAYIFIILAILLATRYAILAALYILSPLAFFCIIFGPTKQYWQKWISAFLNWAFLGVTVGFFVVLALNVIIAGVNAGSVDLNTLFVGFVFLYIGYKMAKGGAAIGSAAILGGASALAGFAVGKVGGTIASGGATAALGAGKFLADKTGITATAKGAGGALTRIGEKLGVVQKGTAAAAQSKQYSEAANEVKNITDNRELARIANQGNSFDPRINRRAAAAAHQLVQNGGGNLLKDHAVRRAISYNPSSAKDFAKINPVEYAKHDTATLDTIRKANAGWTSTQVEDEAVRRAFRGASMEDINKMDSASRKDPRAWEGITAAKLNKNGDKLDAGAIKDLQTHLPAIKAARDAEAPTSQAYKDLNSKYNAIDNLA